MELSVVQAGSILTRTCGFLETVCSHSLQPYRGCALGSSLCGVGCYVRHNRWVTRGRAWGSFVEARTNAAEVYARQYARERAWARGVHPLGRMGVFLSSSTEPFQPAERKHGVTASVLRTMLEMPPDELIVQTHSPRVADHAGLLVELSRRTRLRVHVSIESDRDGLPGLPRPASGVADRVAAARRLREAGLAVVVTVAPLLPIDDPEAFFARTLAGAADAVVIDHFAGGDGTPTGWRTARTPLPAAMAAVCPRSVSPGYRDEIVAAALRWFPGRVGAGIDGFAGRFLPSSAQ